MITILEGPDFAGKSTIAANLGHRIIHNGPVPEGTDAMDFYTQQLLAIDPREDVVFDRGWVGELIYGPIFRGRSGLTYGNHLELTDLATRLGSDLFFVNASDPLLIERFRGTRGDDMIKGEDQLMRIAAQYRLILNRTQYWRLWK